VGRAYHLLILEREAALAEGVGFGLEAVLLRPPDGEQLLAPLLQLELPLRELSRSEEGSYLRLIDLCITQL